MKKILIPLILVLVVLAGLQSASAQEFKPRVTLGDGKDGRVFKNWVQNVRPTPVTTIRANVQRVSGGGDVYVNARFGNDGQTLQGGRRIPVTGNTVIKIKWDVGGVSPNGKPLVIKAYNGEVKLNWVEVRHSN